MEHEHLTFTSSVASFWSPPIYKMYFSSYNFFRFLSSWQSAFFCSLLCDSFLCRFRLPFDILVYFVLLFSHSIFFMHRFHSFPISFLNPKIVSFPCFFLVLGPTMNADRIVVLDDDLNDLNSPHSDERSQSAAGCAQLLLLRGDVDDRGADCGSDNLAPRYVKELRQKPVCIDAYARIPLPKCDDHCDVLCGTKPHGSNDEGCNCRKNGPKGLKRSLQVQII